MHAYMHACMHAQIDRPDQTRPDQTDQTGRQADRQTYIHCFQLLLCTHYILNPLIQPSTNPNQPLNRP